MPDKSSIFTERARRALTLAQEEAQRRSHMVIDTEHLLLGLMREEDGVAVCVLRDLGIEPEQIREQVERNTNWGQYAGSGKVVLSPKAKRVIELAVEEKHGLGHHYLGTEHLLLGLIREGQGSAADVLKGLGVSLDKVRSQTKQVLVKSTLEPLSPSHWACYTCFYSGGSDNADRFYEELLAWSKDNKPPAPIRLCRFDYSGGAIATTWFASLIEPITVK